MNELRDAWTDLICSPMRAGRYLYTGNRGKLVASVGTDAARLKEFLDRLSRARRDDLFLYRLFFLLQPRVQDFFANRLHGLTRSASYVIREQVEHTRRGARGKILWPKTYLTRTSGRGDDSTFVVRRGERSSDVPENRLLKLFLSDIAGAVEEAAKVLGTRGLLPELDRIRREADLALKEPHIQHIPLVPAATPHLRRNARRNRNRNYGELADLQQQFDLILRQERWALILELLRRNWFEPVSDDDLFELYTLALVMDVLEVDAGFGQPTDYGLIRPGRKDVARFVRKSDRVTARVYFDQSPTEVFGVRSMYTAMVAEYDGLTGAARRPDVMIEFELPGAGVHRLLIESKNTAHDDYRRESLYKMFAYLQDFSDMWAGGRHQSPKIILLFPQNASLKTGSGGQVARDVRIAAGNDRARVSDLIKQALVT